MAARERTNGSDAEEAALDAFLWLVDEGEEEEEKERTIGDKHGWSAIAPQEEAEADARDEEGDAVYFVPIEDGRDQMAPRLQNTELERSDGQDDDSQRGEDNVEEEEEEGGGDGQELDALRAQARQSVSCSALEGAPATSWLSGSWLARAWSATTGLAGAGAQDFPADRCCTCQAPLEVFPPDEAHEDLCKLSFQRPALPCARKDRCRSLDPSHYRAFWHDLLVHAGPLNRESGRTGSPSAWRATDPAPEPAVSKHKQATLFSLFRWPKPADRAVLGDRNTPAPHASDGGPVAKRGKQAVRKCPFYKWVPDTHVTVDAFSYGTIPGCTAYFLSHFHYDHYGGLTSQFKHPIYCSEITARLIVQELRVDPSIVRALPMNENILVCDGIRVTLLDANHCPGAAVILFDLPNGRCVLHTGDFRCSRQWIANPLLRQHIDVLFLDTTYCSEKHTFPPQEAVLNYLANLALKHSKRHPRALFLVGSYTVGKERAFLAIAHALGARVWANGSKRKIFATFCDPALDAVLVEERSAARVHVVGMGDLRMEALEALTGKPWWKEHFDHIVAIRPTGWAHSNKLAALAHIRPVCHGAVTLYSIPYSEHSSFSELKLCVQTLRPRRIVPTVNVGSAKRREEMASYFRRWLQT